MKSGPRIATAVAVGYALGRSRRMKMAITVGGLLAGRRLKADPKELLQKGSNLLSSSPELSELSSAVRGQLLEAAKTAATAAASNKINALGASLTERAAKVREPASQGTDADEQQPEQAERSGQRQAEPEEEREPQRGGDAKPRPNEPGTAERSSQERGPAGRPPEPPKRPRSASERSKPKPPASPRRRTAGSAPGGESQQEGAPSKKSPRPKRRGNDG